MIKEKGYQRIKTKHKGKILGRGDGLQGKGAGQERDEREGYEATHVFHGGPHHETLFS